MAEAKAKRTNKRQLGQFMTPEPLARRVVQGLALTKTSTVLEPGFGQGSFLIALIDQFLEVNADEPDPLGYTLMNNVFGVEKDPELYEHTLRMLMERYGGLTVHNLELGDFFKIPYMFGSFDFIVGNPPYGGTFDADIEDALDRKYGMWRGHKLKKETYSFFIAHSLELLAPNGHLRFISSDTFMTIKTMSGLRRRLMDECTCAVERLDGFSDETKQPVLVLEATKSGSSDVVVIDGNELTRQSMEVTQNFSWQITDEMSVYFTGKTLGDFIVATGGLVTGNNELFVRDVVDGKVVEPFEFEFFEDPITLQRELERARLNQLSDSMQRKISAQEAAGVTRRNLRVRQLDAPRVVALPHPDYRYYNKADGGIVYTPPKAAIYWKDEGDAVLTYKRNGNWYLHGVGGQKFYGREGMTWQLVAPKINMRFLPEGYIIDSGGPSAFLRDGVPHEEFWFIFGWCLTDCASRIMKTVLNHTRNIQGKDVERLPYPTWVPTELKADAIALVSKMVTEGRAGRTFTRRDREFAELEDLYARK